MPTGQSQRNRKLSGGEAVVEALEAEDIRVIYGLPGISTLSIYDALYSSKIVPITVKYEANAAIMADVQGRLTGEPGVCLTIAGPGATNIVTAMAQAYDAASPVVNISGAELGDGRYGYFHGVDDPDFLRKVFEPVTKWSHRIEKVRDIPHDLTKAFKIARSGRKGPVHVEIPLEVLEAVDTIASYPKQVTSPEVPAEEVMRDLVSVLSEAEKPLIFAGAGVVRDKASGELSELAEILEAPVMVTYWESNVIPQDHPLFGDVIGCSHKDPEYLEYRASNPVTVDLLEEADVVLGIGLRLGTPESELLKELRSKNLLHLDVEDNKFADEFDIPINVVSGIKVTLQQLNTSLKQKISKERRNVADEIAKYRLELKKEKQKLLKEYENSKPIHPAVVVDRLRSVLERDAIVTSDIGNCQAWLSRFFEVYTPNSYLDPGCYGAMGFALPAAVAAKVLFPDRQVVAVAGDGGFFMSLQELHTAVENKLNIMVVVLNDAKYNTIWHIQKAECNGRFIAVDMYPSNFAKYAETYGIKGMRVEEPSDLKPSYEEALSANAPSVIDVIIDQKYFPTGTRKVFMKHKRERLL